MAKGKKCKSTKKRKSTKRQGRVKVLLDRVHTLI